jgi:hypothetical protein
VNAGKPDAKTGIFRREFSRSRIAGWNTRVEQLRLSQFAAECRSERIGFKGLTDVTRL